MKKLRLSRVHLYTTAFTLFVGLLTVSSFNRSSNYSASTGNYNEKATFIPNSISIPQYTEQILTSKELRAHAANSIRLYSIDVPWPMGESRAIGKPLTTNTNSSAGC